MEIDLATFRLQIGYQNPLSNFRAAMRGIAGTDAIPDYSIELIEDEAPLPSAALASSTAPASSEAEPARRGRRAAPARVVITHRPTAIESAVEGETTGDPAVERSDAPA